MEIIPGILVRLNPRRAAMFSDIKSGLQLDIWHATEGLIPDGKDLSVIRAAVESKILLLPGMVDEPLRVNVVTLPNRTNHQDVLLYPRERLQKTIKDEIDIEWLKTLHILEEKSGKRTLVLRSIQKRLAELSVVRVEAVEPEYRVENIRENE